MRRPSLKMSLIGIFTFIGILFAGFAYVSVNSAERLNTSAQNLSERWLASVSTVDDLKSAFQDVRLAISKHLIATTPEITATQEEAIKAAETNVQRLTAAYALLGASPVEKESLNTFIQLGQGYKTVLQRVLELSRKNQNDEAAVLYDTQLGPIGIKMNAALDAIAKHVDEGGSAASDTADVIYASTSSQMMIVIAFAAIALLVSLGYVIRSVANPIVAITGSMRKLAEGDVATDIPFAGRADEIGAMAAAVETFRQAAVANARHVQEAEASRIKAEANRIADQKHAEAEADERLNLAAAALAAGLKRLASGDLAFQLTEAFAPGFEGLRHDFNSSVSQLGETLSAMSESIATMDTGTKEISSGANDLSKRTEQQAASLEETAAALDQITVNVANSSKRTEEARIAATQANQSATKSAEVVSQAEEAMGRIETSSQHISSIIGVIDEIAFQTNLLALNAGVEAARAGEAGRGFAVVAQEVRELAQRSAKAAKEIKGLIQNSNTEVESGVKLVRETGIALKTIGGHISEINGHMESIATSAREQATGLAEINMAVNSMDQGTQQNAAMVEESTAASVSLAGEATKLRDLVSQFQLGKTNRSSVAALRQTALAMAAPRRSVAAIRPASHGNTALKQEWAEF